MTTISDPNLVKLVHVLTSPCADNGRAFTRTERIKHIRGLLEPSDFTLMAERPLALIWQHKHYDPKQPTLLVSTHIDSLYDHYHSSSKNGLLLGTYDNSITNAIVIDQMIRGILPTQVLVAFTGDEECSSRGAGQAVQALRDFIPGPIHPELVVVLDVTEEGYQKHSHTVENIFCRSENPPCPHLNFAKQADLERFLRGLLPDSDPYVICKGAPDESWRYNEHGLNCCAFCLPIKTITGDMHDDEGVYVKRQSLVEYSEALCGLLEAACATIHQSFHRLDRAEFMS